MDVTENTVMNYYLELMKQDKILFLANKPEIKKKIKLNINKLKKTKNIHDKILLAKDLWMILFEASMVFIDPDKQGYDKLFDYFGKFVEFEELIFASDSFYRDHTLHSLWVYFLGEFLYNHPEFKSIFANFQIEIHRSVNQGHFIRDLNYPHIFGDFVDLLEKVNDIINNNDSTRCVIALTHDLGYPLKKISKINKSISKILPYFSISKFGEFSFHYDNIQQFYIENLLELLSCDIDFLVDVGDISYEESQLIREPNMLLGQAITNLSPREEPDEELVRKIKEYFDNATAKEIHIWRRIFAGTTRLTKSVSRLMRFANDFEEYQHGIMSAYLLTKLVNSFSNIQLAYSDPSNISIDNLDIPKIYSKLRIMQAMSDHTSPGYKMRDFNSYSALLVIVDEMEEFSRLSRANQFRQFVNEFCKTSVGMDNGCLCFDFIFDDASVIGLDPERAFKDKCKKFLKIFDIPNLQDNIRIKFRCIGKLPQNTSTYELNIAKELFKITIDGEKVEPSIYLKTSEVFHL